MELLRKELAKKAGAQQKLHAGSATSSNTSSSASLPAAGAPKRFLKRGEIEQLRVEQELAEKRAREERKLAAEAEASQRFSKPAAAEVVAPVLVDLPLDEVIRRLRKLRKPITLFGEDEKMRQARLRAVEDEVHDDTALHDGHDIENVFLKESVDASAVASDSDEDEEAEDEAERSSKRRRADGEALASGSESDAHGPASSADATATGAASTSEKKRISSLPEWIAHAKEKDYCKEMYVAKFFKQLLREWEYDLAKRPDHVKRSAEGRVTTKTQKQCKDYMQPFFRRCKRKDVDDDILEHIFRIVKLCEEREYVQAGDQYLQMAIGNAPWPIGVTSVGIHDRAARTKISTSNVAHVMNDEYQRKYITSIKRLMTLCQKLYPTDPSKMLQ